MGNQRRFLAALLSSTLGGAIAWFVYLKVLRFTSSALFGSSIEPGLVDSIFVQVSVTALTVFAASSILITALSHLRWWIHWLAFVAGIVICVGMRFHPQGIELTIDVFLRAALVSAVLSSGIAAQLTSYFRGRDSSSGGSGPSLHRISTLTLSQEVAGQFQRHFRMCRISFLGDKAGNAAVAEKRGREPYESGFVEAAEGAVDGNGAAVAHETVGVKFLKQAVRVENLPRRKNLDRGMERRRSETASVHVAACGQAAQSNAQDLQKPHDTVNLLRWIRVLSSLRK